MHKKLYMIRSSTCPGCGLSELILNGTKVANKNKYQLQNIHSNDPLVNELKQELDGLNEAIAAYPCIYLNADNGRFTRCHGNTIDNIEKLFS